MEDRRSLENDECVVDTVSRSLEPFFKVPPLTFLVNMDDFLSRWKMTNLGSKTVLAEI